MTTPRNENLSPGDVGNLVTNVRELRASVQGLTDAMVTERERRDRQRKRDWVAILILLCILVGMVSNRLNANDHARTACEAVNATNKTLYDLIAPLNVFVPTPVPEGASAEETQRIKKADAARKATSDLFFADLEKRTKPKKC